MIKVAEVEEEPTETVDLSTATFKDGAYTGEGQGRAGKISIEIEVKDGKFTVTSLTHEAETRGIGAEPIEDGTIAGLMEDAQSPEFDVIAGATLTCNGAAEALTNALTQAAE